MQQITHFYRPMMAYKSKPQLNTLAAATKICLLCFFIVGNTWATDLPAQITKAVQHHFPGMDSEQIAVGDLNQDGVIDFAVIVPDKKQENYLRIVVMLATSTSDFTRYAISGLIPDSSRRQPGNYLEIKRNSLFLRRTGSNGALSDWSESFQFQFRDQALVLIGEESATLGKGERADLAEGKSINYLSKQVIFWRTDGIKRKEVRKKFTFPTLAQLASFDYAKHMQLRPRILLSHLDQELQAQP